MTPQEIYDRTKAHLMAQGPAIIERGKCMYRTRDGKRCAIGYWIPDEDYKSDMEGRNLYGLMNPEPPIAFNLPDWFVNHQSLLLDLQSAHDNVADDPLDLDLFRRKLLDRLLRIAKTHNLTA